MLIHISRPDPVYALRWRKVLSPVAERNIEDLTHGRGEIPQTVDAKRGWGRWKNVVKLWLGERTPEQLKGERE